MVVESVVSSVVVGKLRKRKILNIADVELRGWYLFIFALFLELSSNLVVAYNRTSFSATIEKYFIYIHFMSYTMVFIGMYLNKYKLSFKILFTGSFLNFLCIMANGGHMPIWLNGLKIAGLIPEDASNAALDLSHALIDTSTRLKILADIIPIPKQYPLAKVLSIGDILIAVGVFIFIQEAMKGKQESA